MGQHKILTTLLAVVALVAFEGDQVLHAIDAYEPADTHVDAAPAGPPSFAKASLVQAHFEAQGHPCEDLGHSEADCPLANIVDDSDIIGISDLPTQVRPKRFETTKNSLLPIEVGHNRQIRGPPTSSV